MNESIDGKSTKIAQKAYFYFAAAYDCTSHLWMNCWGYNGHSWGGSCECPDGSIYQVSQCIGGIPGECNRIGGPWSWRKVTCDALGIKHFHSKKNNLKIMRMIYTFRKITKNIGSKNIQNQFVSIFSCFWNRYFY